MGIMFRTETDTVAIFKAVLQGQWGWVGCSQFSCGGFLLPCASLRLRSLYQLCVLERLVQKQAVTSWLW